MLQWLSTDSHARKASTSVLCLLALGLVFGVATTASAQTIKTIHFDDLLPAPPPPGWPAADPASPIIVPDGYEGFDWESATSVGQWNTNPTGNCVVSPVKCAYNTNGNEMVMSRTSTADGRYDFTLDSAWITGIHRSDLDVELIGENDGLQVFSMTVVASALAPTLFNFNSPMLDTLRINSSGGTNIGLPTDSTRFAWDDVTVTVIPEPSTALLIGLGLGGISALRRRRD